MCGKAYIDKGEKLFFYGLEQRRLLRTDSGTGTLTGGGGDTRQDDTAQTSQNTTCEGTKNASAYPEDEVEEEKHVLDTFGAAFDSHGGRWTHGYGAELKRTAAE